MQKEETQIRLLAATAHDLKTPLLFIKGAANQARQSDLKPELSAELLRRIEFSSDRLLKLVESLLCSAATEQGMLPLEPVNAADIIQQAQYDIWPYAEELGFKFDTACSRNLPLVLTHRLSLRRVLFNLMDNAVKYSQGPNKVVIRARRTQREYVRISVRDYGIGLTPSDLKKIFALYGRAEQATTAVSGSGLGLYIASQLSEAMNAKLSVQALTQGASFSIRLPIAHQLNLFK